MNHMLRAFEVAAERRGLCLKRNAAGEFYIQTTHEAWRFWREAYEAGQTNPRKEDHEQRQGRSSLAPVVPRVG